MQILRLMWIEARRKREAIVMDLGNLISTSLRLHQIQLEQSKVYKFEFFVDGFGSKSVSQTLMHKKEHKKQS